MEDKNERPLNSPVPEEFKLTLPADANLARYLFLNIVSKHLSRASPFYVLDHITEYGKDFYDFMSLPDYWQQQAAKYFPHTKKIFTKEAFIDHTRFVISLAKRFPALLKDESNKALCEDKYFISYLVMANEFLLPYVPQALHEDKSFILDIVVKTNGLALPYVPKPLKLDYEVIYTAIEQNPAALQFAPIAVRDGYPAKLFLAQKIDKEIAMRLEVIYYTTKKIFNESGVVNHRRLDLKNLKQALDKQAKLLLEDEIVFEDFKKNSLSLVQNLKFLYDELRKIDKSLLTAFYPAPLIKAENPNPIHRFFKSTNKKNEQTDPNCNPHPK